MTWLAWLLQLAVGWFLGHHTTHTERAQVAARIDALNTERGFQ